MRILIADDHTMFRNGLMAVLQSEGFEIVGEAADGVEAIELALRYRPDVVVLDVSMPRVNGIEAKLQMDREGVEAKVVVLTMFDDEASVVRAFQAGVEGYVLKTQASTDLVQALREIEHGHLYLSPKVSETMVDSYLRCDAVCRDQELTSRERQVLQMVAEGNPTKTIARTLNLTVKTIESHRNRLMKKLDASNIAGLVKHAVREGVIRP